MAWRLAHHCSRFARALAVAAGVVALVGCGASVPTNPTKALGDAAKASAAIARATQQALSDWCPQAFQDNAKHLTHSEATGCLMRAKNDYLRILRKKGFDPTKIANGGK